MQSRSLYIHIPFCLSKCLFCSFVIAVGQSHRMGEYVDGIIQEALPYRGAVIETVYWGGGTPALLSESLIERLVKNIRSNFNVLDRAEWTLEANPENLSLEKSQFLRSMGFNRVSIGVQSFHNKYLKFLGRNHTSEQAQFAFQKARQAGFENINVDLMFSFPHQTMDELNQDLKILIDLHAQHVSLYGLTIEENSKFYAQRMTLDEQEYLAKQYVQITEVLNGAGISQYEISNFARPGFQSQHNSNYWNGREYIGLGVGAHSFLNHRRYWNVSRLQQYLERMARKENPIDSFELLTPETRLMERILFGLRTNQGIQLDRIETEIGCHLDEFRKDLIRTYIDSGFLQDINGRLIATMKGRLVLDELSVRLI